MNNLLCNNFGLFGLNRPIAKQSQTSRVPTIKLKAISCNVSRRESFDVSDESTSHVSNKYTAVDLNRVCTALMNSESQLQKCSNLPFQKKPKTKCILHPIFVRSLSVENSGTDNSSLMPLALRLRKSRDDQSRREVDSLSICNITEECFEDANDICYDDESYACMKIKINAQADNMSIQAMLAQVEQFEDTMSFQISALLKYQKVQLSQFKEVEYMVRLNGIIDQKIQKHMDKFKK